MFAMSLKDLLADNPEDVKLREAVMAKFAKYGPFEIGAKLTPEEKAYVKREATELGWRMQAADVANQGKWAN